MNAQATATIAQLAQRETRVQMDDISNENLYAAAMDYAKNYAGTFPFMVSMFSTVMEHGQWLTEGQAVAVLNCAVADYRYNAKRNAVQAAEQIVATPQVAPQTTEKVVADGWYTIVGPKGGHRTLRLQSVEGEPVKQWLAFLNGSDNENSYQSIGFVNGAQVTLYNKYQGQYSDIVAAARFLVKNAANIGEYGRQYAVKSGKCYVCNRKLTTPESIANGIGPVCASKGM